jgi:hypothetical protein
MGIGDVQGRLAKAELARPIRKTIRERGLTQFEAADLFDLFVDPKGEARPAAPPQTVSDALESEIAAIAKEDPATSTQLAALCEYDLDASRRRLLAGILRRIGTQDALLQSLLLIHDDREPSVRYAVERGLGEFLVERRPDNNMEGAYSLVPRSGGAIRRRLFEFWLADDGRKASAEQLLRAIDEWRLEHGKPTSEPRRPPIEAGVPWPPL